MARRSVSSSRTKEPRKSPGGGRFALTFAIAATGLLYVLLAMNQTAIWTDASWFASQRLTPDGTTGLLTAYVVINAALIAIYFAVVWMASRPVSAAIRGAMLTTPLLVMAGFVFVPPAFSIDGLSYLAHGATSLLSFPADAYSTPPKMITALPYGEQLLVRGWNPAPGTSPYGPLWSAIEVAIVRSGISVDLAIILLKVLGAGAAAGTGLLVWRILGMIRPTDQLAGTVAFLWNPVVIVELAGEGHNDGLMVFFALLGLYLTLSVTPALGMIASAGGSLVKYLPALFVIPQLAYLWRVTRDRGDLARKLAAGLVASLVLTVVVYLPFAGPHVFDGVLRSNGGGPWPYWPSISGVTFAALRTGMPSVDGAVGRTVLLGGLFAIVLVVQSARSQTSERLIRACSTIALVYIYVVSAAFWPWYAILPIAFLVMERDRLAIVILAAVTITSRVIAPFGALPTDVPFPMASQIVTLGGVMIVVGVVIVSRLIPEGGPRDPLGT